MSFDSRDPVPAPSARAPLSDDLVTVMATVHDAMPFDAGIAALQEFAAVPTPAPRGIESATLRVEAALLPRTYLALGRIMHGQEDGREMVSNVLFCVRRRDGSLDLSTLWRWPLFQETMRSLEADRAHRPSHPVGDEALHLAVRTAWTSEEIREVSERIQEDITLGGDAQMELLLACAHQSASIIAALPRRRMSLMLAEAIEEGKDSPMLRDVLGEAVGSVQRAMEGLLDDVASGSFQHEPAEDAFRARVDVEELLRDAARDADRGA